MSAAQQRAVEALRKALSFIDSYDYKGDGSSDLGLMFDVRNEGRAALAAVDADPRPLQASGSTTGYAGGTAAAETWTKCVFIGNPPEPYDSWYAFVCSKVKQGVTIRASTADDWTMRRPLSDEQLEQMVMQDEVLRYNFALNGGAGPVSLKGKKIIRAVVNGIGGAA